jgi:serine/threonine protein kinase/tetratricopeptide (TPR) repeat protein
MDARWQRVDEIFNVALELPLPDRAALLERLCGEDNTLRREIESLLAHDHTSDQVIEAAVAGVTLEILSSAPTETVLSCEPPRPSQIGPYRVIREIGSGGMGVLYEAIREDQFQKRVALKIVKRGMDTASIVRRFHRERQILAGLSHPNITALLDGGTTSDGQPYFVMEYVQGQSIADYCDTRKLTIRQRLEIFRVICAAVQYAHQNLVIHRDLKPSNILVTSDGAPKLLDFGIAKILNLGMTAETMDLTLASMAVMTPEYASPEQVRGEAITTSTDVYSLGVLLYELLTGHRPYRFKTRTPQEVERVICEQQPEKPSTVITRVEQELNERGDAQTITPETVSATRESQPQLRRRLRGDLDNIVLKALHKQPGRRYTSVEQFSEDIRHHLTGLPVVARNDTLAYRAGKFILRHKTGVLAASTVALALIVGVIVTGWMAVRASRAEQEALAVNEFFQNDVLAQASANQQARPSTRPDPDLKVRTALDRAAARIEGKFGAQPLLEASIRQRIGETYKDLGLYTEAERQVERSLELRRRELREKHPDTLSSASLLAFIYRRQGKYKQAEPLSTRVLELSREVRGERHRDTLDAMDTLAGLYEDLGRYAQAEPLFLKILEVRRQVLGEEHTDTLEGMNNLAALYTAEGKYAQVEPLLTTALEICPRVAGEEHPLTLIIKANLAGLFYRQGKYAQAEPLFTQVLEVQRRLLGEEHANTLMTMNSLANTYRAEGEYGLAEPLFTKVLETRRRVLGEEHADTLRSMQNLALAYVDERKYAQAETLLLNALQRRRRVLGEAHPEALISMNRLAVLYRAEGKYSQAEALFTKALELQRRVLGEEHPDTLNSWAGLGRIRLQQQKYAEAESTLRDALQRFEKATPESWERYNCESMLGASLAGQKKYAEAEPLLVSGYEELIQRQATIPAGNQSSLTEAGQRIVLLYHDWVKPAKAAEWKQRLQTKQPANHR